jgi:hypothetical protein
MRVLPLLSVGPFRVLSVGAYIGLRMLGRSGDRERDFNPRDTISYKHLAGADRRLRKGRRKKEPRWSNSMKNGAA